MHPPLHPALLSLLGAWTLSVQAATLFEANTADLNTPENWSLHQITARNPGGTCTFHASGISSPNPDRIQVNWTMDNMTTGRRGEVGLMLLSAAWDPASDGAIEHLDMRAEQQVLNLTPKSRFLLVQDGIFYISSPEFHNTVQTLNGLGSTDFVELDRSSTGSTALAVVTGRHPDFGTSGKPLQFGLWGFQAATAQAAGSRTEAALEIRSFRVTVTPAGPGLNPFAPIEHPDPVPPAKPTPAPGLPNMVVILCDDLGHGDLGLNGHPHIETPNIDALRSQGAYCSNYYSAANICSPSRAAMLSGRMPYRLGLYSFIRDNEDYVHLTHDEVTLPQVLGKVGYECANIGKWHVSHLDAIESEDLPSMRHYGWDYWLSSDNNLDILNKDGWWRNETRVDTIAGYAAEVVSDEAIAWLNTIRDPSRPFLLFANYYEPHHDSEAPAAYKAKYADRGLTADPARYYGCVEHLDHQVGRVLTELDTLGLATNTLVLFTSDNGPNPTQNSRYGTAAPYRGTKYQVWDGSTHVPAIIRWPGQVVAGSTITEPTGSIDLLQTFAAIADAEALLPTDRPLDGSDLSPLLTGSGTFTRHTPLQWHYYKSSAALLASGSPQAALRTGDLVIAGWYDAPVRFPNVRWMPIPEQNGGINDMDYLTATGAYMDKTLSPTNGSFRLYDLSTDVHQDTDLYDPGNPNHVALRDQLITYHQALQARAPGWGYGPWDIDYTSYTNWRREHWSGPDATDEAVSGAHANPDGDLWVNYLEYAWSLNPTLPDPPTAPFGPDYRLKTYLLDSDSVRDRFQTYTFTVPGEGTAQHSIGYSTDLESWEVLPEYSVLARRLRNKDLTYTVTYRDQEPVSRFPHRFMQLRAGEPDP